MKTQFEAFPKGPQQREIVSSFLGDGIFAVDGVKWFHQRKIASYLFTHRRFRESMTRIIREHTSALLRILERVQHNGETLDLFKLFNKFTSEAFTEIGFGVKFNSLDSDQDHPFHAAFDSAQRTLALQFMIPPWVWQTLRVIGIGGPAKLAADMKVIDDTVLGIVSQYLEEGGKNERKRDAHDLFSLLIDRFDLSPESRDSELNPRYLRDRRHIHDSRA